MNNRIAQVIAVLALLILTGGAACSAGFVAGGVVGAPLFRNAPSVAAPAPSASPADREALLAAFWEAWDIVHQNYVDQPLDDKKLLQGAIRGMVEAVGDPYTAYTTPEEAELLNTSLTGELQGIGAQVEQAGDMLRIVSPMPGSPAEAAGVLPDDLIVAVDDEPLAGLSQTEMVLRVRGPAGSTVKLTVKRAGENEFLEFNIVRARITIPSVESKMLDGNVGYIKINDFGQNTARDFRDQLRTLLSQRPVGLVLDLRNNPGGYLNTAVDIASQFIGEGVILREQFGNGSEDTYPARPGGLALDIPLVVLINKGSASASEIVAGAIQDRGRGTLVGETSFGKGSVQRPQSLSNNQGEVRVTIARWLTPNGRQINKVGIEPDVVVELTRADREAKRDPQLERAVELLTQP